MAQLEKSVRQGMIKSVRSLQSIKVSYKGKVQHLRDALGTKQIDLEAKCQSLQDTLEELEESRNRYAALYDFAPVGYVTLDQKGCIKEINLTCASLLGLERAQLIGTPMSVLVVKSDMKMFLHHMYRCRQNDKKVITELSLTAGNGPPVQVQLLSIPQNGAGDSSNCYKTVITDISERKLYERELARLDRLNLVGEMAAGIGHEVRNPMTTIKGFLQLLRERDKYIQEREIFDLMVDELDRANSIITEFLSLAKDKAVDLKKSNLNKILKLLLPLIEADGLVTDKYIKMETQKIPDLNLDEKEIRQLILNLVRNGLEAMSPGGGINIRTYSEEDEVVLSVQDNGKGIEPDVLEKIGTPFFTTKDNGTGLGLAVCYSIAARHNAKIDIETGAEGTSFLVKFKVLK